MRGLLKDIDIETLYSMRRNDMSNAEIASSLGVSVSTIYNIIGPQPKGLRKRTERKSKIASEADVGKIEHEPIACLVVMNRNLELAGAYGKYVVDVAGGIVNITNAVGQTMSVRKDQLEDLVNELNAIKRKMEVLSVGNEAW